MAGQPDGSVYVNTELDPQGFKAGSEQLKTAIKSLNTQVKALGPTLKQAVKGNVGAMRDFKSQANELRSTIAEIESEMEALGHKPVATADYADLAKEMEKAEKILFRLQDRQGKMEEMGVDRTSNQWKSLQIDIRNATKEVQRFENRMQELENSGQAFMPGSETAEYARLAEKLNTAKAALAEMQAEELGAERKARGIGVAFRKIGSAIGSAAKAVGGMLLKGLKGALSVTKKLITGNKLYGKSFNRLGSSLGRFSVGLLGVRAIYGILQKAVQAYMSANQGLANQLSSCWTSLGNLLGPLITKIINLVSTAIAYVTAFLKLLGITGSAASDAVEGAGGAAEKAQKSLTGFDEINALQDNSSGGGGGGGAGSTPLPEVTLPDWTKLMIDQIKAGDWAGAATTLTTQLNAMVASVDWAGVGNKIGYYLNGALTFLATAILTFDWIALGSDLATSLNGIIANVDWGNLAVILASKLIILLQTLTGFFETLDGAEFGNAIHEFITGGINAVDWVGATGRLAAAISDFIMAIDFGQLGTDLSDGCVMILNAVTNAFTSFDWKGLGSQVADFFNGIDWSGIFSSCVSYVSDALVSAFDLLSGFAGRIDWAGLGDELWGCLESLVTDIDWGGFGASLGQFLSNAVTGVLALVGQLFTNHDWGAIIQDLSGSIGTAIGTMIGNIDWKGVLGTLSVAIAGIIAQIPGIVTGALGGITELLAGICEGIGWDCIAGFFKGISDEISKAGTWLKENLVDPVVNWVKDLFGIHSPSTVFAEIGDFLIQGMLEGISNAWSTITSFFSNALSSITSAVSTAWSNIKAGASTAWSGIKTTISNAWTGIKTGATNAYTAVKNGVSSAWNSIKSSTSSTWSNIKSSFSTTWTNIKSVASTGYNAVKSGISSAWSSIKSTTSTTWSNIKSTIQNQGWSGIGSNICSGLKNGISNGWSTLTNWVKEKAKSLLNAAKSALGIHSPSRLFRDEVGINIGLGIGEGVEDSERSVLNSVAGVADAIAAEFAAGEYTTGTIIPTAEIDGAITSFTDKITDSFTALMEKMDAIAKRVTFNVPAFAGSVVPYRAAAAGSGGSALGFDMAGIEAQLENISDRMSMYAYRQESISRELNMIAKQILDKRETVKAVVTTGDLHAGMLWENKRQGRTIFKVEDR